MEKTGMACASGTGGSSAEGSDKDGGRTIRLTTKPHASTLDCGPIYKLSLERHWSLMGEGILYGAGAVNWGRDRWELWSRFSCQSNPCCR